MSPTRYTAHLESIRDLAPTVREVTLRLAGWSRGQFRFSPGQSMAIEIPGVHDRDTVLRYFSLASSHQKPESVTFLLSLSEEGIGASYLSQQDIGAEVNLHGPHGTFLLRPDEGRDLLFVATGTGVAPFRSMLHAMKDSPPAKSVRLIWGLRSEEDLYYQEDFHELADRYPWFTFETTLTRFNSNWQGQTGRVTKLVTSLPSVENLAVYVCGHQSMVNEVTEILSRKGPCPVYQEEF
ncbi:MAG: FAD-binding oxidoreductase [Nitrospirales bacterium]|nr:hypothetical protein [Nitrospira sp.]MDR4503018.1 FAD-binding oxidoreductase [Nitrospirales bacterium]